MEVESNKEMNNIPLTQDQLEKKLKRKENAKNYCYNMKSFNKKNFQKQGDEFLTVYFQNLSNINEDIKKYYFGKSTLTLSKYENIIIDPSQPTNIKKNISNLTVQGIDNIYSNLLHIKEFKNYNHDEYIIQPTLGQGVFIVVRGFINNSIKFTINFTLIIIKNEFHILNQYINIDCS